MSIPRATYRLQLHEAFTLDDARRLVPYLARVGVSHAYLSPITQATRGSEHGYDVTDPTRVAEAIGGLGALRSLSSALVDQGMGVLLDIVPNHMAASTENAWWADLLENAAESDHAATFDTPIAGGDGAMLRLPVLGGELDQIVERGELRVGEHAGEPVLQYFDHWFPIPRAVRELAAAVARGAASVRQLIDALPYRLSDWRSVSQSVCYRRFFDITGLVGVRVEDPAVFQRTHAGILEWLGHGFVDGLRVDHIDGLRDPAGYLDQLAQATARVRAGARCYTVVEKILAADEHLPDDWSTDGTTGYEFIRITSGFLVDPDGYARLDRLRRDVTGEQRPFSVFVHDCKRFVLQALFPAELADVAQRIAALAGTAEDATTHVLRELTAGLGVYRTYISRHGVSAQDRRRILQAHAAALPHVAADQRHVLDTVRDTILLDRTHASEEERARVLDAVARWQQLSGPAMAKGFEDTALYAWPALLAVNEVGGEPAEALDAHAVHQFLEERAERAPHALSSTSTHDTKRSEDVRARLLVLAEHAEQWAEAVETWRTVLRSDGARLAPRDELVLLQTLVGAWPLEGEPDPAFTERIQAFMLKAAREAKQETSWLDPDEEYERVLSRTVEHVLHSPAAEQLRSGLREWVERIALHGAVNSLVQTVLKCTAPGVPDIYQGTESWRFDLVDPDNRRPVDYTTLARVADDLAALVAAPAEDRVRALLQDWRDGRIKQYVLMAALALRRRNPAMHGTYTPAAVHGTHAHNVLAFRRSDGAAHMLALLTRWPARVSAPHAFPAGSVWRDTAVQAGAIASTWRCIFTGRRIDTEDGLVRLAAALDPLPFALLEPV